MPDGQTYRGWCRVNVTHPTASLIADHFQAYVPTSRISDLAYVQARGHVDPQFQNPDASMANTSRMVLHSYKVTLARRALGLGHLDLVRPLGKDWQASPKATRSLACNGGWQAPAGIYKTPSGIPCWQPTANAHNTGHTDYSQTVCMVRRVMMVDGMDRDVADVARDPVLCALVSDEGPIATMRHPSLEPIA